jgi:hypothetical protein
MITNSRPRSRETMATTQTLKLAPLMLLAALGTLTACSGRADGSDPASELGGKGPKVKVTPGKGGGSSTGGSTTTTTPPPTTTTSGTVSYDTSIGDGVGGDGIAILPLRSGASRYFVNSVIGSDGNSCAAAKNATTPKASITAAASCVAKGAGDQLLVAQGTSYSDFPSLSDMDGYSPVYPMVIQTYDPADPANDAKIGHPAAGTRPKITKGGQWFMMMGGGTSPQYTAVRGFDFDSGTGIKQETMFLANTTGLPNYFLFENNILRERGFTADMNGRGANATNWIIRGNAFYGGWAEAGYHMEGVYLSYVNYTLEDNVIWHSGWKVGANRDDPASSGGLVGDDVFRHAVYSQFTSTATARRNLIVDSATDGGMFRGDSNVTENLGIDNPIGLALGGGTNYNTDRPGGVLIQADYNAQLGSADIDTANPRGGGITTSNGKSGSYFRHGIIAHRSQGLAPGPTYAAVHTEANFNVPSYMNVSDTVIYNWALSGNSTATFCQYPGQVYQAFSNMLWDDPTSGTNVNVGSAALPNPYTADQLYQALGFGGTNAAARKQAFITYAIEHPEAHIQYQALNKLWTGYGISHGI